MLSSASLSKDILPRKNRGRTEVKRQGRLRVETMMLWEFAEKKAESHGSALAFMRMEGIQLPMA